MTACIKSSYDHLVINYLVILSHKVNEVPKKKKKKKKNSLLFIATQNSETISLPSALVSFKRI